MRGFAQHGTIALAALLTLLAVPASAGDSAQEARAARAFEIHFRPLVDAADVISPLLSEAGTVTLRPRLSTLVVQDRRAVLERVAELLAAWDLPPRDVEITLSLFLGMDRRDEDAQAPRADHGLSREVRGVFEKLSDFTKWTAYEPLGSRSVTTTEGETVVADLSAEYRVVFVIESVIESVHETHGAVKFESLSLQRITAAEDGSESVEDLYTAGMVLPAGRLKLVGAASDPNSRRALFLALQTRLR